MGVDERTGTLVGAYLLGDVIGRGGMGVVYRATHVHLGRDVALKVLAPELSDSDQFRKRFLRESRLAASIEHPNVVPVYDAGEFDGTLYIAMRFVDGIDLAELLRREAPLEPSRALALLDQVGSALDAAHARGLIHRDVKPANVMIEAGCCYLTDFGLTKRASATAESTALTRTGAFLGTLSYIAPEHIEGREIGPATDIYALGCVLHECLTGSPPYTKDSEVALIYAHLQDPPPRPSEQRRELPASIDTVVATALAKRPEDRYATCADLLDAAREALGLRSGRETNGQSAATTGGAQLPSGPSPRPAADAGTRSAIPVAGVGDEQPPAATSSRTPRWRLTVGAAVLGIAAIAIAAVLLTAGGDGHSGRTSTPTPGARVVGNPIDVGKNPIGIAGNSRVLWVANNQDATVTRVTKDGKIRTDIALPRGPFGVFTAGAAFWVSSADAGEVTRITSSTGLPGKPIRVGRDPGFLGGDENSVFVSDAGDGTVTVLDARAGVPIGPPIRVGRDPQGIASGGTAVWVADAGNNNVARIVDGRVIKTIPVGRHPVGVAVGDNAVWVANEVDDSVSRIDLSGQGANVKTIRVGRAPFAVAFGFGSAWVTNSRDDTVTRLDARTGQPVGKAIPVGQDPTGIAVIGAAVWVTDRGSGTVQKIRP